MAEEQQQQTSDSNSEPSAQPNAKAKPKAATATDAPVAASGEAPAAKAKKEKPPALEAKPFQEFIAQHYLPTLRTALEQQGLKPLSLTFEQQAVNVRGLTTAPACWQVHGEWTSAAQAPRAFTIYFFDEDIQGAKGFTVSETGGMASTLESFMIDERKVDLNLLTLYTLMRLNGQKWLARN